MAGLVDRTPDSSAARRAYRSDEPGRSQHDSRPQEQAAAQSQQAVTLLPFHVGLSPRGGGHEQMVPS